MVRKLYFYKIMRNFAAIRLPHRKYTSLCANNSCVCHKFRFVFVSFAYDSSSSSQSRTDCSTHRCLGAAQSAHPFGRSRRHCACATRRSRVAVARFSLSGLFHLASHGGMFVQTLAHSPRTSAPSSFSGRRRLLFAPNHYGFYGMYPRVAPSHRARCRSHL